MHAGRHQFVAGREQRNFRPPVHRNERVIHAGGERQVTGRKPMTVGDERIAGREVEPFGANVAAFRR